MGRGNPTLRKLIQGTPRGDFRRPAEALGGMSSRVDSISETDWNSIAETYSSIRDARRETVFPFIKERLADLSVSNVLDYGGGDGSFALACKEIVPKIIVYEPTPRMNELARAALSGVPSIKVVSRLEEIEGTEFDAITFNAVWMTLPTWAACLQELRNICGLLKEGGHFFASVTHPCFRDVPYSTYSTDFDRRDYLKEGKQFLATVSDGVQEVSIVDTHWSLGAMSGQLKEAGFLIQEVAELSDVDDWVKRAGSPWLVLICRRSN